jgi:hypothetical protein
MYGIMNRDLYGKVTVDRLLGIVFLYTKSLLALE